MREGAAILLTDALAAIGVPVVEREERLQAFDRLQLPANATLSRASTIRIGHALSATSVDQRLHADAGRSIDRARARGADRHRPLASRGRGQRRHCRTCSACLRRWPSAFAAARAPSPSTIDLRRRRKCSSCMSKDSSRRRPPTALAFLEQALKAAPAYDRVRLAMWDLHSEASEHQKALDVISAVTEESKLYRESRFRRALSLMHLKRFDDALQTLRAMHAEVAVGDDRERDRRDRAAARRHASTGPRHLLLQPGV